MPLLYVPRSDFAEHPILEQAILEWGHGYPLEKEDFYGLNWKQVLKTIQQVEPPEKVVSQGALLCAAEIESFFQGYHY